MNYKRLIVILIIGAISTFLAFSTYAQVGQTDLQRATRETDRPIREEVEKKLGAPPKKPPEIEEEKAEEEVEGPKFFIKKINLVGVESFSPDEFKPILAEYENREVSFEELKILAKRIQREYLKRGIISACFVPPQDIKEGIVTLRVIEAKMGQLNIQDHKYFDKDRVTYYWELKPDEILRYDKISRSLQFMNKNPDRNMKAALSAGKKPQTTDVSLSAETHYPLHLTYSIDREGSASTGHWRQNAGFRHNNFLGFDDSLLSGYMWGTEYWGAYTYHTLPITDVGTSILYGFSHNVTKPKGDYKLDYDLEARTTNTSFFVHQDLYKKDEYLGDIFVGLDAKDKEFTTSSDNLFNRDRLRILRTGGNFVFRDMDSVTYVKPQLSQGVDFLGARDRDPLSTRYAKNIFTKWNLGIQHKKMLPLNTQLSLKLDTQTSFTKLASQEQFSLGGINSVRGYLTGEYLGDHALQANAEFLFPPFFIPENVKIPYAARPLKEEITGLVFFDYGLGATRGGDIWKERKRINLVSVGTGLRARLFDQALLRLEWGFPLGIGDRPTSGSKDARLHISLDFEDRFPQEIERINKLIEEENIAKWSWNLLNEELKRPDSPLREKVHSYLYLARKFYQEGDLNQAKEYYVRIFNITKSLYSQAEAYVRDALKRQKELWEYNKVAQKYYQNGEFEKAKEAWQKIIEEAETKPLVLEFS